MVSVIIQETEMLRTVSPIATVLTVVAPYQERGDLEEVMIVQQSPRVTYFHMFSNFL